MNNHQFGSEIRQSDEIMRKLNQIKNAIDGRRQFSPNNLMDYLPNQRLTSQSHHPERLDTASNPQSYRLSLQKKLERLFKEEKKMFHENQGFTKIQTEPISHFQSFIKHENRDAFTIQKMELKIKQLERKYLKSSLSSSEKINKREKKIHEPEHREKKSKTVKYIEQQFGNYQNVNSGKKNKSTWQKQQKQTVRQRSVKKERIEQKSEKKLMSQIGALKKQIRWIKQTNVSINEKIDHKEQERREKKQRSRYLLKCILAKLIQIQQEIKRRERKESGQFYQQSNQETKLKNTIDDRESLKIENTRLISQVQELNLQLKKEANEKKMAEQRSKWVQSQLRKLNRT